MDANALLAIYTKVQQIYNTGDSKFLSFPLDFQFIFSPESLSLLFEKDAATAASFLNQRADFSRVMNRPVKSLFPSPDTGDLLWDVYQEILTTAEIADNSLSPAEKKAFQKAEEFLFDKDENGVNVPSEKYTQYSEFRDRSFAYEEQIANLKVSETLTDSKRKSELTKLRKAQAENDALWAAGGLRQEVEKHLDVREKVLASSPIFAWARMKDKCLADLSVQTDLTGASFATTFLFPSNVLEQPWCTINVGKEEVAALMGQASPDVKKRLTSDYPDPIESFSFEYRSVGVQRPWFDANLFKSRLWRFPATSGQMISFGSEKLLGKFPAYISALLLLRNFHITYSSGKTINSFGSLATNQKGSEQEVSVLAYICKKIPVSPNPDESVKWPTTRKTATLKLQQKAGGTLHAYIGGEEIDSGEFRVGEKIRIKAVADANCVMNKWKINGEFIENPSYTYECILGDEGLTVLPYWEYGDTLDANHVSVKKDTLVSIDKGPANLDMDHFSALCQVKVIGEKAFKNYSNLSNVTIGKNVEIIGEQIFPNCTQLENVSIPSTTRSIHKRAFIRNGFQEEPFVQVDPEHETYTSLDGVLLEKSNTITVKSLPCQCGAKFIFSDHAPETCPKCGRALDASHAQEISIRRPDVRVPFRVSKPEAQDLIREFYAKQLFVQKEFKDLVTQSELSLKPVYVPMWEWRVRADSGKQAGAEEASVAGNQENTVPTQNVSVSGTMVAVPVSRVVSNTIVDTGNLFTEKFSFGQAPTGTAFEFHTQNLRECQKNQRNKVLDFLRNKAGRQSGGDKTDQTNYISEANRLVYNPFWIGSLEYNGESHPFYVDGYSRKVTVKNAVPKDKKKLWILLGSILAGIVLIVLAILLLAKNTDKIPPSAQDKTISVTPANDGFTIQWEKATDETTPVDLIRYQVLLKGPEDTDWRPVFEKQGVSSYTFSNLEQGVQYAYSVIASDESGNSIRYLDGTTTVEKKNVLSVNSNELKVLLSNEGVVVSWDKATDHITPDDRIKYQVYLKKSGDSDWSLIKEAPGLFSHTFSGLTPDTDYSCKVMATDGNKNDFAYVPYTFHTMAASKTEYDVRLISAGQSKFQVVKAVKEILNLGLKDAKDLVDNAPITIKEKVSKTVAESLKAALKETGAEIEIVNSPISATSTSTSTSTSSSATTQSGASLRNPTSTRTTILTKNGTFSCDGVYNSSAQLKETLDSKLNRSDFTISFDFNSATDGSGSSNTDNILTFDSSRRVLGLIMKNKTIHITVNNQQRVIDTGIHITPGEWQHVRLAYCNGKITINGKEYQVEALNGPGDNVLSTNNYGNGHSFIGSIRNLVVSTMANQETPTQNRERRGGVRVR